MVRSMAPVASGVNIRINAICPALVRTNLPQPELLEKFTEEQFTPMSTIMRCFSELGDLDNVEDEDWITKGKSGETVECNLQDLMYHEAPKRPEQTSYHNEEGAKAWREVYVQRNRNFAMQEWMKEEGRL